MFERSSRARSRCDQHPTGSAPGQLYGILRAAIAAACPASRRFWAPALRSAPFGHRSGDTEVSRSKSFTAILSSVATVSTVPPLTAHAGRLSAAGSCDDVRGPRRLSPDHALEARAPRPAPRPVLLYMLSTSDAWAAGRTSALPPRGSPARAVGASFLLERSGPDLPPRPAARGEGRGVVRPWAAAASRAGTRRCWWRRSGRGRCSSADGWAPTLPCCSVRSADHAAGASLFAAPRFPRPGSAGAKLSSRPACRRL